MSGDAVCLFGAEAVSAPEREAIDDAVEVLRRGLPVHSEECDRTYADLQEYENGLVFDMTREQAQELNRLALAFIGSVCEACDAGDIG